MVGGLVDFSALARDTRSLDFLPLVGHADKRDAPLRHRRARTLFALSHCIYSPRTSIPPGYKPAMYQLSPLDKLNQPWFGEFLHREQDGVPTPKYPRRGILVADEGGMGKTLSSAIIALDELYKDPERSVVVVCPKMMKKEWESIFKWTPFPVSRIRGSQLIEGHCRRGLNIIGKHEVLHALAGHDADASLAQHQGKISLLILDEAHEGFLVDPEATRSEESTSWATLQDSIGALTNFAARLVFVTATPMRRGRNDLIRLCGLIDGEALASYLPVQDDAWYDELRTCWLPALEHLREGTQIDEAMDTIAASLSRFVPLPPEDIQCLEDAFATLSDTTFSQNEALRVKLADDLHPLGRYLSVTLRDDLGEDDFRRMFRTSSTTTHPYQNPRTAELVESLEAELDGGGGWRGDLNSCSLNALDQHYKFARRLRAERLLEKFEEMANQAWRGDERLPILLGLVKDELETCLDTCQGVVVFSSRSGTNRALKQVLEEEFGDSIEVFLFHPPTEEEHTDRRRSFLRKARKHAQSGPKLPVILSGESGSIGQNMEWANVVVHWDAIRSPAMLEQKSWRLDRRVKPTNNVTLEFKAHHFVHMAKQTDHIDDVNQLYQQQRLLLGDRRFFQGDAPYLIPSFGKTEAQTHTAHKRLACLQSTRANWLNDFILGKTTSPNSHAAEVMAQAALIQCSGFDFWDGKDSQQMLEETPLSPQSELKECDSL